MDRLTRPRHPLLLAALAMALSLPALGLGFQLDDHFLRLGLSRPPLDPEWRRSPLDLFAFFRGDPAFTRHARDQGTVPWWTSDALKLAFARPLSGLTHGLDFALWPQSPRLMHAHSLLWLGACVALAALLYRRLALPPAAAALAALVFAVDDAHGTPAAWIANRNALVATVFALLCLLAHDRWRRDGWRPGAWLAPPALLLGVLGGETALAAGGYLLGYALFLERGPWGARALSLVPCTAAGVAWALGYRALGYGTAASTLYIDPGASPLAFLGAFARRAPLLLFGQWALPADLNGLLSVGAQAGFWVLSLLACMAVAAALASLLRREPAARFLALGMLLSVVPASATFPSNRLLMLTSLGGAGLVGWWMAEARGRPGRLTRAGLVLAVLIHLVGAPLGLLAAAEGVKMLGAVPTRGAASLPRDPALAEQHLLMVAVPSAFFAAGSLLEHALSGAPRPRLAHVLGSSLGPTTVFRPDERTLVVRPALGYLAPPGSVGREGGPPAAVDRYHVLGIFDRLYRDTALPAGGRVALAELSVEVVEAAPDGRPAAAAFRFERPLEDPHHRWVAWGAGGFEPFTPPPVGGSLELPAPLLWPR